MVLFADERKIQKQIKTQRDTVLLQSDVEAVAKWYLDWPFALNVDKFCALIFYIILQANYVVGLSNLCKSDHVTDLGIVCSAQLYAKNLSSWCFT